MKKRIANKEAKTGRKFRKLKPNPGVAGITKLPLLDFDFITKWAGDQLITVAVRDCSFEEKTIISALLPEFVKLMRKGVTQADMKSAADKLWNDAGHGKLPEGFPKPD